MSKEKEIRFIISLYNKITKNVNNEALNDDSNRAYGGIIRSQKGTLVEDIAKLLVRISWVYELKQDETKLKFIGERINIPINKSYIENYKNLDVKKFIEENIEKYYYPYKPDVLVEINNIKVLEIECKAYTENAMMKRIIADCELIKKIHPNLKFCLLQLESQLGGDYSKINEIEYGSPSTHTLFSYSNIELNILTLLEGERKVDKPIHKEEFWKELKEENLNKVISKITEILRNFIL